MGLFEAWRRSRERRGLIAAARSVDWGKAQAAIKRLPDVLDADAALAVLLPLSRGDGGRLANPLTDLGPSPTLQFAANLHISAAIEALGRVSDPRASDRLLVMVGELPGFAKQAVSALGGGSHATAAPQLEALAVGASRELRQAVAQALWQMGTERGLDGYVRITLSEPYPYSEQHIRKAWAEHQQEKRHPKPAGFGSRPLPLP